MRESRTFGSVGGEGGNVLAYPAISCRQWGGARRPNLTRSRHSAECRVAIIKPTTIGGYRHAVIGVADGESPQGCVIECQTVGTAAQASGSPALRISSIR